MLSLAEFRQGTWGICTKRSSPSFLVEEIYKPYLTQAGLDITEALGFASPRDMYDVQGLEEASFLQRFRVLARGTQ